MSTDPERRSRLLSLKLRALVRTHLRLGEDPAGTPHVFAPGAAFVTDDAAWFLVDGDASRSIGPVIAWAARQGIDRGINIITEDGAGVAARRASWFDGPVTVWSADDRDITPAVPDAHLPFLAPKPGHLDLATMIEEAGAEVVVEHGVVVGEVRGLEMCRVVDDETTGAARLEVGMGAHDREAFALVHGHLPAPDALRQVIGAVLPHREPGADQHPLNQFGAERLLRWNAMQDPASVGCGSLHAAEPPAVRTNLKDAVPCVALGVDGGGESVAVTFAHGIDLDAVPFALDAADRLGAARAVLAVRARDITESTRVIAARSLRPVTVIAL